MSVKLELATFHPDSVPIATRCGVQRLELCEDYSCGGLTPSLDYFEAVREEFPGKIFVMIRPRAGGYIYSDEEFDIMLRSVKLFRQRKADGFVAGFFRHEQEINEQQLKKFVETCDGLPVTFHRSFDGLQDWKRGLDTLIKAGCTRLLTSGDGNGAYEGRFSISEMIKFAGDGILILPGGGIRSRNVQYILDECHPAEVHSAAIRSSPEHIVDETELVAMMKLLNMKAD